MNRNRTHTGRRIGTACLAAAVALCLSAFGGCGVQLPPTAPDASAVPETTLGAKTAVPSATSAAPATSATQTPSRPTPSASIPVAKPTASAPTRVTFTSKAIAGHKLGSSETEVVATLTQILGKPTGKYKGLTCDLYADPVYRSGYWFGPLRVSFEAADAESSSPRTLVSFLFELSAASNPKFVFGKELPITATFAQLKKRYPKGMAFDGPGSPPGGKFFALPGGDVTFVGGYKAKKPDSVMVGSVGICE